MNNFSNKRQMHERCAYEDTQDALVYPLVEYKYRTFFITLNVIDAIKPLILIRRIRITPKKLRWNKGCRTKHCSGSSFFTAHCMAIGV